MIFILLLLHFLPRDLLYRSRERALSRHASESPFAVRFYFSISQVVDRLLWNFHKQSLLWRTFDRVGNACSEAGADHQWQLFSEKLLRCFRERSIGPVGCTGQHNLDDLIRIACEIEQLVKETPPSVASAVQNKIVCLLTSLLALLHLKKLTAKPCRMTTIQIGELTLQWMPTNNGKRNKLVPLSQVQPVLSCNHHLYSDQ